jgi:hypothetical protein
MEIKRMSREGRNWLAEVVVHSKGGSSRQTVLMDSNGNIISRRE